MNNGIIFASFAMGAFAGAFVTYKVLKTKYERFAQEEIDSMREYFSNRKPRLGKKEVEESELTTNSKVYADILTSEGYADYSSIKKIEEGGPEPMKSDKPRVISPDEFGDEDYDIESLTYYADGVLTDDWDNRIEDVEGTVGIDSLTHFGDNKDDEDSVFVRNDRLKTDYEILRDERRYSDVVCGNPYPPEE